MAQALITINAVPGSNDALPIATLVQLNNQNTGGEISFAWTILDQPPGAADALSNPAIQNPTFTPSKEGTYLIGLVVNAGPNQLSDRVVAAVRFVKSYQRVPAAGEKAEDGARGWAGAIGDAMGYADSLLNLRTGVVVAFNNSGGTRQRGEVVQLVGTQVIKTGLPGQETVPTAILAAFASVNAANARAACGPLAIVEGAPDGTTSVPNGNLMVVRTHGMFTSYPFGATAAAPRPLVLSAAGLLVENSGGGLFQGRQVGIALSVGANFDLYFDGLGGCPAPTALQFGSAQQFASGAGDYYQVPFDASGTNFSVTNCQIPMPYAGVIYGLYWRSATLGGAASVTMFASVNGVDTSLGLLAGTSGALLLATPLAFNAGDRVALFGRVTGAPAAGYTYIYFNLGILPTRLIS